MKIPCNFCEQEAHASSKPLVILSGGACWTVENAELEKTGYLSMSWRVPPDFGGGKLSLDLQSGTEDGQFDLYFCNTACLRSWMNTKIDELDEIVSDFLVQHKIVLETEIGE